jgi:hypothetical protein
VKHRLQLCCLAGLAAVLATGVAAPARADFFDDARRTVRTDIPHFFTTDFPHFFQDDIPCAFGGKPTSHTRTSCPSPGHGATPPARKKGAAHHAAGAGSHAGRHVEAAAAEGGAQAPARAADRPGPADHDVTTYLSPTRGADAARSENRRVAIATCGGGFVLIRESSGTDAGGRWYRLDYGCLAKDEPEAASPTREAAGR